MRVRRVFNGLGTYDFYLNKDDKTLGIFFTPEFDVYMTLTNGEDIKENGNDSIYFDINEEDLDIYRIFDETYCDIIEGNVFMRGDNVNTPKYHELVDENQNINWISDDESIDTADILRISKIGDTYRLRLTRNHKAFDSDIKDSSELAVKISNQTSRYNPFNFIFMRVYSELQKIGHNYNQLRYEELEKPKVLEK